MPPSISFVALETSLCRCPSAMQLMKDLGYHDGYQYPHDYPGHFTPQQYLPDALVNERLWHGQHNPTEEKMYQRMLNYWGSRFEK